MKWCKKVITRKAVWVPIVVLLSTIMVVQFVWPSSTSRPFTYWGDQSVSLKNSSAAEEICQNNTKSAKVIIVTDKGQRKAAIAPSDIEAQFTCDQFAQAATSYPLKKKITPFSIFTRHSVTSPHIEPKDQDQFFKKIDEIGKQLEVVPQNAKLTIKGGAVAEEDAISGVRYEPEKLASQIKLIEWPQPSDTTVYGEAVKATIEKSALVDTKKQVEERLSGEFALQFNGKKRVIPVAQVGTWLSVQTLDKDAPEITYHPEAVEKYLTDTKKELLKELGMKSITTSQSSQAIVAALKEAKKTASLSEIPSSGSVDPIAASPDSIAAFISTLAAKGESVGLYVKKIGGGTQYGTNADRVYTSASTYKLFVAYSVMRRIDSGELAWSSPINGTTVEACFEKMIVVSDNACPEAFLAQYGFSTVQAEARSIGATQASFSPGNMRISAQSLGVMLEKLHSGSLVSADSRNRLLGLMRRQVYRRGVPAGTSYQVADKVGFLFALLHDASVIETPQGNYVVVIMTDGSSWGRIAELTRMIASTLQ